VKDLGSQHWLIEVASSKASPDPAAAIHPAIQRLFDRNRCERLFKCQAFS
jgi:hypothetical protein